MTYGKLLYKRRSEATPRQFQLPLGSVKLGRDEGNDLVLDAEGISRHHALIVCTPADCTIIDLESTTGTFLNQIQLQPYTSQPLRSGDIIRIGAFAFVYMRSGEVPTETTEQPISTTKSSIGYSTTKSPRRPPRFPQKLPPWALAAILVALVVACLAFTLTRTIPYIAGFFNRTPSAGVATAVTLPSPALPTVLPLVTPDTQATEAAQAANQAATTAALTIAFGQTAEALGSANGATQTAFAQGFAQTVTAQANLEATATSTVQTVNQTPSSLQTPTPLPHLEAENVEAEYPSHMTLGHADTIRVSLVYIVGQRLTPTIEVIGNTAQLASPMPVGTPGPLMGSLGAGYQVFITAHLDASGFDVKPSTDLEYRLTEKQRLDWVWVILPTQEGQQALNLRIDVRWEPLDGNKPFTFPIYRQRLVTNVDVPIFTWGSPLQIYTILGAVVGSLITWAAPKLYARGIAPLTARPKTAMTHTKAARNGPRTNKR